MFPDSLKESLKTFGARLRWLRERYQLSLADFGARIRVGRSYISKLENGKSTKTSEQFLYSVCREFSLNREWLLNGRGNPFDSDQLNEIAKSGAKIFLKPLFKTDEKCAAFGDALFPAGIAITFSPTIEALAAVLGEKATRNAFREPVQAEITRILMEELSARIAIQSKQDSNNASFSEPASELGKMAVASVKYYIDLAERERTKISVFESPEINANQKLTNIPLKGNNQGVKAKLPALLKRLNEATKERGTKTALAKFIGVSLPKVSQWLSGAIEPSGETTLRLLHWVEQQERQK